MQLSIQVIMELNQISINCNAKVTRVPIADASIQLITIRVVQADAGYKIEAVLCSVTGAM